VIETCPLCPTRACNEALVHIRYQVDIACRVSSDSHPRPHPFINTVSSRQQTPLGLAIQAGCLESVKLLLQQNASVRFVDYEASRQSYLQVALQPSSWAASAESDEMFSLLLAALQSCSQMEEPDAFAALLNHQDEHGTTALHMAASLGASSVTQKLLNLGADAGLPNVDGDLSLHIAACKGHMDTTRVLVAHGVPVDSLNSMQATPLHRACSHGTAALAECDHMLRSHACNEREQDRSSRLHHSQPNARAVDAARVLLSQRDASGWQPLHCAVHSGSWQLVQLLVAWGACACDVQDNRSGAAKAATQASAFLSALHLACYCGAPHIVRLLLDSCPSYYAVDMLGPSRRTAFHYAALGPLMQTEASLFSLGWLNKRTVTKPCAIIARTTSVDEVQSAYQQFWSCIVQLLGAAPGCVHQQDAVKRLLKRDESGASPLAYACAAGNELIVDFVLRAVSDWKSVVSDKKGRNLLHYLCASGREGIAPYVTLIGSAHKDWVTATDVLKRQPLHYAAQVCGLVSLGWMHATAL
jgi:ankyrin repeat protein